MVVVEQVYKSFRLKGVRKEVLHNISFRAENGEVLGLLGPNGAGKTTTLRIIATLLKADSGTVMLDNLDVATQGAAVRNRIGFLTGDMKLSGHLNSREVLSYFGALNHMEAPLLKRRINQLTSELEMESYLDVPIAKLSAGMAQKTSIALSLLHDPKVIIFDEPTSNLDVLAVKVVSDFIRRAKDEDKCIILSTHILSEAERLCDKVAIIHEGEILDWGNQEELLKRHQTSSLEDLFFHLVQQRRAEHEI